ncbi:MAG: hypothetical protein ABEJ73_00800 [Haloplanus sp.]
MVGPSLSDDDRRTATRRLKMGFVALVGCSGGLVALASGATALQALGALAAGLFVGWTLIAYLTRVGQEWRRGRR